MCVCVCVSVCLSVSVFVYLSVSVPLNRCACGCLCLCFCVCEYVRLCVCLQMSASVNIWVSGCIHSQPRLFLGEIKAKQTKKSRRTECIGTRVTTMVCVEVPPAPPATHWPPRTKKAPQWWGLCWTVLRSEAVERAECDLMSPLPSRGGKTFTLQDLSLLCPRVAGPPQEEAGLSGYHWRVPIFHWWNLPGSQAEFVPVP